MCLSNVKTMTLLKLSELDFDTVENLSFRHINETNILLKMFSNCPLPSVTMIYQKDIQKTFVENINLLNFYKSLVEGNSSYFINLKTYDCFLNTEEGFYDIIGKKIVEDFDSDEILLNIGCFFDKSYRSDFVELLFHKYDILSDPDKISNSIQTYDEIVKELNGVTIPYHFKEVDNSEELNLYLQIFYLNSISNI